MNFKPTTRKIVVSVVIGCVIGYLSLSSSILTIKPTGGLLGNGTIGQPLLTYDWSKVIVTGVVIFVVIYIIWSLFQKKQNS